MARKLDDVIATLPKARKKRVIRIPGIHEINRMADRRPEFYGDLVKPNQAWPRFTPGGPVVDES